MSRRSNNAGALLTAFALILGSTLVVSAFAVAQSASAATELSLYVSPAGSGTTCSSASPCSLATAKAQVEANTSDMTGNLVVNLAGGTYRLSSTLSFGTADSGTNGYSVIYQAEPGTTPILSGGTQLTGWTADTGGIWQASVPSGFNTRQLYVNGVRGSRASGPLPASLTQTSTGYTASNTTMASWANASSIEFVYNVGWTQQRCDVASISGTTITMQEPCFDNSTEARPGDSVSIPTYVENAMPLLTAPGQWYLNQSTNTIYYMPRANENLATADVEVPNLQTVVSGTGTESAPLTNLVLSGITVEYGTWLAPSSGNGFSEVQANATLTGAGANTNEGSCTGGGTCPYGAWTMTPGNVTFAFAKGVTLEDDTFTHLGAAGVQLGQDVSNSTIVGNTFADISGSGLEIGNISDNDPSDLTLLPTSDVIEDNWVHNTGADYAGAAGIFMGYAIDTTIENNQVNSVPYSGISANWGWGIAPTATTGNVIDDNLVFDYMQTLNDGGGIYVLGPEGTSLATGLTISGNVVHTAQGGGHAIYTDGGSEWVTMTNNVLYGTGGPDWGGCYETGEVNTYGNFVFSNNYWQDSTPDWPCGNPTNVTMSNNTTISATGVGAPTSIVDAAGIQPAYQYILYPAPGPNLALNEPAQALYLNGTTATMQSGSTPANAVDGNLSTFAQASGASLWELQVNLQSVQTVGSLEVVQPTSDYATAFHVNASTNGTTWTTVATETDTGPGVTMVTLPAPVSTQYLQVVADEPSATGETGGEMALSEVEVFAPVDLSLNQPAQALYLNGTTATMQTGSTPGNAVDGNLSTFAQASGQILWELQVNLQSVQTVGSLEVVQPSTAYATAFHVNASTNGTTWTTIATLTHTGPGVSMITLPAPVSAQYLQVVADEPSSGGETGGQMAISEFDAFAPVNLALNQQVQALYTSGSTAQMQPGSTPGDAVDGSASTFAQASGQYLWDLQVDLPSVQSIGSLEVIQPASAYATAFHINASTDGVNWTTVATLTGTGPGVTMINLSTPTSAQYLQVVADEPSGGGETGGQMAISEFEAFAPSVNLALNQPAQALYLNGSTATMQPSSTAADAVDGNLSTFAQASGQYLWQLQVNLQSVQNVAFLEVIQPSTAYATAFHINASTNGTSWTTIATLTGTTAGDTMIALPTPVSAQYLQVVADEPSGSGQTGGQMAISEFEAFAPSVNFALNEPAQALYLSGATASMQPTSTAADAVDGNGSSFAQASGQYLWELQVNLQSVQTVETLKVIQPSSAYATAFHINASTNGTTWTTVATLTGTGPGVTVINLSVPVSAQYLQVVADEPSSGGETGGQMAISEFEAFA